MRLRGRGLVEFKGGDPFLKGDYWRGHQAHWPGRDVRARAAGLGFNALALLLAYPNSEL